MFKLLPTRRANSPQGFTLIELLVVITIIAILAAILFPVFASAREKARQSSCMSNEKQLAMGFTQYIQDFDEIYPNDNNNHKSWAGRMYQYVKSTAVFTCPDDQKTATAPNQEISYAYNDNVGHFTATGQSLATSQFVAPAQTVLIVEVSNVQGDVTNPKETNSNFANGGEKGSGSGWIQAGTLYECGGLGNPVRTTTQIDSKNPKGWHNEGSNFVMSDCHVKWFKGQAVSAGRIPTKQTGCDQDACAGSVWGNAATTDQMGGVKGFAATFSPY